MKIRIEISYHESIIMDASKLDSFLQLTGGILYESSGYDDSLVLWPGKGIRSISLVKEDQILTEKPEA